MIAWAKGWYFMFSVVVAFASKGADQSNSSSVSITTLSVGRFQPDKGIASQRGSAYVLAAATLAAIGQIMLTLAYQRGHTFLVSLLGYSQVVFTSVLGILLWSDALNPTAWFGMALIVLSGFIATVSAKPSQVPAGQGINTAAAPPECQPKRA